jgi:hypothetical protein
MLVYRDPIDDPIDAWLKNPKTSAATSNNDWSRINAFSWCGEAGEQAGLVSAGRTIRIGKAAPVFPCKEFF